MEKIIEGVQKKYIIYCLLSVSITFIGLFLMGIELIPKYYTLYTGLLAIIMFLILSIETYVSKKINVHTENKRLNEEKLKVKSRYTSELIGVVDCLSPHQYSIFILILLSSSNSPLEVQYSHIKGCGLAKYLVTDKGIQTNANTHDWYTNKGYKMQDMDNILIKFKDVYYEGLVDNLNQKNKISNFDMEKCKHLMIEDDLYIEPIVEIFGEQGRKWADDVLKKNKK